MFIPIGVDYNKYTFLLEIITYLKAKTVLTLKTGKMGRMGTPSNLKSADGNAYVTRYIIPGHDFQLMIMFRIQFLKLIIQRKIVG